MQPGRELAHSVPTTATLQPSLAAAMCTVPCWWHHPSPPVPPFPLLQNLCASVLFLHAAQYDITKSGRLRESQFSHSFPTKSSLIPRLSWQKIEEAEERVAGEVGIGRNVSCAVGDFVHLLNFRLIDVSLYSGKFLRGPNFGDFHDQTPTCENFIPRKFLPTRSSSSLLRKPSILPLSHGTSN